MGVNVPILYADGAKANTITLRVPSYYSKALHSLASKPPPVVQMSKLTEEEIARATKRSEWVNDLITMQLQNTLKTYSQRTWSSFQLKNTDFILDNKILCDIFKYNKTLNSEL